MKWSLVARWQVMLIGKKWSGNNPLQLGQVISKVSSRPLNDVLVWYKINRTLILQGHVRTNVSTFTVGHCLITHPRAEKRKQCVWWTTVTLFLLTSLSRKEKLICTIPSVSTNQWPINYRTNERPFPGELLTHSSTQSRSSYRYWSHRSSSCGKRSSRLLLILTSLVQSQLCQLLQVS